eukprot:Em0004g1732a
MDRHGVPSKDKQKAGIDYNFVTADRDYVLSSLSVIQGDHQSCYSESPCQEPGYVPQRKPLTMPAAISAYEAALRKTLIYKICLGQPQRLQAGIQCLQNYAILRILSSRDFRLDPSAFYVASPPLSKTPLDLRLMVSREVSQDEWDFEAILKVIEKENHSAARCKTVTDIVVKKDTLMKSGRLFWGTKIRTTTNCIPNYYYTFIDESIPEQSTFIHINVRRHQDTSLPTDSKYSSVQPRHVNVSRVRDILHLPTERVESLVVKTFGSEIGRPQRCDHVNLCVKVKRGVDITVPLLTVPTICEPLCGQPIIRALKCYCYLSKLDLADDGALNDSLDVGILIGADLYWSFTTGSTRQGSGPTAIETKLYLSGPATGLCPEIASMNLLSCHTLKAETSLVTATLYQTLKMFWDLEAIGVKPNETSVCEEFIQSITFRDGRCCVRLPWKMHHRMLPDNLKLCQMRLCGLIKRRRQSPHILWEYDGIIKEQINHGIVETVDDLWNTSRPYRTHYLPHHGIIREDKLTTKLRIVFDASAKTSGPSLNECLYKGPFFKQKIADILRRFQLFTIGLVADIEKLYKKAKEWFVDGAFNLHKFHTNCRELQRKIDAQENKVEVSTADEQSTAMDLSYAKDMGSVMLLVKRMLLLCTLKFRWPAGVTQKFVAAKTRVAPLQVQTIPRLELLGALLLSRLLTSVTSALSSELTLNSPICFTDSKVALFWIRGCDKKWRQFVENRIREIRQLIPILVWKHCAGKENPADLPSRGTDLFEITNDPLWLKGPSF